MRYFFVYPAFARIMVNSAAMWPYKDGRRSAAPAVRCALPSRVAVADWRMIPKTYVSAGVRILLAELIWGPSAEVPFPE